MLSLTSWRTFPGMGSKIPNLAINALGVIPISEAVRYPGKYGINYLCSTDMKPGKSGF